MKKIHIISGGTMSPIATHLALCAPASGFTGMDLESMCLEQMPELEVVRHETRLATGCYNITSLVTNEDVERLVDELVADSDTKIIFMPVALCDFTAHSAERTWTEKRDAGDWVGHEQLAVGKDARRIRTSDCHPDIDDGSDYGVKGTVYPNLHVALVPAPKIIPKIRAKRKDIFLVGFKTTDGVTEDEQYIAGLGLLKSSSCNLVFANDVKTKTCMVITPEEARYHVTTDRHAALTGLVEMAKLRSHLTFTRSTVVAGTPVPWSDERVPPALRQVVDHLIAQGAYKPFRGATVGHFACKLNDTTFLTSQRKTNFNDLAKLGLVMVRTDGPDTVLAYGAKPSVGGQSQRILFGDHPEYDCVVHAHVPLKECIGCHRRDWACDCNQSLGRKSIPIVSQREFECGSHQCGKNTSNGMKEFTLPSGSKIMAVFLAEHGPNILFNSKTVNAQELCDFIDANFDLSKKTGGYVS